MQHNLFVGYYFQFSWWWFMLRFRSAQDRIHSRNCWSYFGDDSHTRTR